MFAIGSQYTYMIYEFDYLIHRWRTLHRSHPPSFLANRIIMIGVSTASIIISIMLIICIIKAFARRSTSFRTIRQQARIIADYRDTFLNPPPYDFSISHTPSYATNPPIYTRNSNETSSLCETWETVICWNLKHSTNLDLCENCRLCKPW